MDAYGPVRCLLALRRVGSEIPVPSRRVLLAFDVFLLVAILYTAFAPIEAAPGASPSSIQRHDLGASVPTASVVLPDPVLPRVNASSVGRRRKGKKRKNGKGKKFRSRYDHTKGGQLHDDGVTPKLSASEVDGIEHAAAAVDAAATLQLVL